MGQTDALFLLYEMDGRDGKISHSYDGYLCRRTFEDSYKITCGRVRLKMTL